MDDTGAAASAVTLANLHIPARCSACFALLSPPAQAIAAVVAKLIADAPPNTRWYQPRRVPLCQQERKENEHD